MQSQLAGSRPIIMGPHACLFRMRPAAPHRRPTRCPAALAAPAEVQKRAAPVILDGDDCIIQSETGSGKTLAFLLPALCRLGYPPALYPDDLKASRRPPLATTRAPGQGPVQRELCRVPAQPPIWKWKVETRECAVRCLAAPRPTCGAPALPLGCCRGPRR